MADKNTDKEKDKEKIKKPSIKVEEIEEEVAEETSDEAEKAKPEETLDDKPVKDVDTKPVAPAVSSFSQLDSAPPSPPDKKSSVKESMEEKIDERADENITQEADDKAENKTDTTNEDSQKKEQISSDEVKEWLKEVRPDTTKEIEKSRGPGGKLIFLITIILLLLGAVVGGVLYFQKGVSEPSAPDVSVSPTSIPEETPEVVVDEALDLTETSISVLNGSGIAGEAGKVKDLLSSAGFVNDNIQTGNADSYDYENISMSIKEDLSDNILTEMKNALSEDYEVEVSEDYLQENSTYDVVIIVGK